MEFILLQETKWINPPFFAGIQVINLYSWQLHATLSNQEDGSLVLVIFYVVCGLPFEKNQQNKTKKIQKLTQNDLKSPALFLS